LTADFNKPKAKRVKPNEENEKVKPNPEIEERLMDLLDIFIEKRTL